VDPPLLVQGRPAGGQGHPLRAGGVRRSGVQVCVCPPERGNFESAFRPLSFRAWASGR
jgi:hypothetical protein